MIELRQATQFDSHRSEPLYVDVSQIESVGHAIVGERSDGATLTMKSGEKHRVWESVDRVIRLIAAAQESQPENQ